MNLSGSVGFGFRRSKWRRFASVARRFPAVATLLFLIRFRSIRERIRSPIKFGVTRVTTTGMDLLQRSHAWQQALSENIRSLGSNGRIVRLRKIVWGARPR